MLGIGHNIEAEEKGFNRICDNEEYTYINSYKLETLELEGVPSAFKGVILWKIYENTVLLYIYINKVMMFGASQGVVNI